jgi:CheY-like chemotaxis protein
MPFSGRPEDRTRAKITGPRVLVVDDESLVADTVADILNRHSYQAVAVYAAKEALEQARRACPDIVLCDVIMPEMSGVEAAIALRQLCPAARIILFSGQAGTSALLERARAQGHDFEMLAKPIHPRELLQRLAPKQ